MSEGSRVVNTDDWRRFATDLSMTLVQISSRLLDSCTLPFVYILYKDIHLQLALAANWSFIGFLMRL